MQRLPLWSVAAQVSNMHPAPALAALDAVGRMAEVLMTHYALGVLSALLLTTNRQTIRAWYRRWFDRLDRWASKRWPVTPKGRDETGQLVEYRPAPVWAQSTTVEFHQLIRHAWPLGEVT